MTRNPITKAEVAKLYETIVEKVTETPDEDAKTLDDRGGWALLPSKRKGKNTATDRRNERLRSRVKRLMHKADEFALLTLESLHCDLDILLVYPEDQLPGMGARSDAGKGLVAVLEADCLKGVFARAREVWTIKWMLGTNHSGLGRITGIGGEIGLHSDIAEEYKALRQMLDDGRVEDAKLRSLIRKSDKHFRESGLEADIREAKARLGIVVNGN